MLVGLTPPDPPLADGVVTLRLPDPERDAASVELLDDPEIVRWILGARPQPQDAPAVFERQLEWWRDGSNAVFSIDAAGSRPRPPAGENRSGQTSRRTGCSSEPASSARASREPATGIRSRGSGSTA
jgi:hypothetical protein